MIASTPSSAAATMSLRLSTVYGTISRPCEWALAMYAASTGHWGETHWMPCVEA